MYNPIISNVEDNFSTENHSEQYNVDLLLDLSRAIKQNELRLEYQPRYDTDTGHTTIFEALVRWQHPTLGFLSPDNFISIAEENGLICKLGLWVFEQCCKDIVKLRHQLKRQINLSVNVSLLQCEDSFHAQKSWYMPKTQS